MRLLKNIPIGVPNIYSSSVLEVRLKPLVRNAPDTVSPQSCQDLLRFWIKRNKEPRQESVSFSSGLQDTVDNPDKLTFPKCLVPEVKVKPYKPLTLQDTLVY